MTVFYGGTKQSVTKQLECTHDWAGPCIDQISRYYKCKLCFVIGRDCSEADYYDLLITQNIRDINREMQAITARERTE